MDRANFAFPKGELNRIREREWILDLVPRRSVGAELGVFRGHFSESIVTRVNPVKLFLVDLWSKQGDLYDDYGSYTNHGQLPTVFARNEVAHRMKKYEGQSEIVIVEDDCLEFLAKLDERLDFVYLDTYHTFEETVAQLNAVDTRLKSDGLILGDDWWPDRNSEHHGVFLGVHDFIRKKPYEIVACGRGGQFCLRRER